MKKSAIEKNREYSEKFIQKIENPEVSNRIRSILSRNKVESFVDLGCGDGMLIHALKKEYPKIKVVGVDISQRRVSGLAKKFPKDNFYVKDVCDTKLKQKFDFVHSSQVIEHVSSDKKMVEEMSRLLKKDGVLFCSSVMKKPWAIYQYRNNGKFVLDPTHEKEYQNLREFVSLFKDDFKLIECWRTSVYRRFFGMLLRIPGFYHVYGVWKLK